MPVPDVNSQLWEIFSVKVQSIPTDVLQDSRQYSFKRVAAAVIKKILKSTILHGSFNENSGHYPLEDSVDLSRERQQPLIHLRAKATGHNKGTLADTHNEL